MRSSSMENWLWYNPMQYFTMSTGVKCSMKSSLAVAEFSEEVSGPVSMVVPMEEFFLELHKARRTDRMEVGTGIPPPHNNITCR